MFGERLTGTGSRSAAAKCTHSLPVVHLLKHGQWFILGTAAFISQHFHHSMSDR